MKLHNTLIVKKCISVPFSQALHGWELYGHKTQDKLTHKDHHFLCI